MTKAISRKNVAITLAVTILVINLIYLFFNAKTTLGDIETMSRTNVALSIISLILQIITAVLAFILITIIDEYRE